MRLHRAGQAPSIREDLVLILPRLSFAHGRSTISVDVTLATAGYRHVADDLEMVRQHGVAVLPISRTSQITFRIMVRAIPGLVVALSKMIMSETDEKQPVSPLKPWSTVVDMRNWSVVRVK